VTLDPQTAALLSELTPPPGTPPLGLRDVGPELARAASRAVFLTYAGREPAPCLTEDVRIDGPTRSVPARLYRIPIGNTRPQNDALPLVVFFHGGGWAMGDLDCYDRFMRDLCVQSGAALLSVDYLLSPENKFPAGLDEGLAAVRWAAQFVGTRTNGGARLAVMGDSAGGNLATVIARRLHAEGQIRLAAQFLLYPMLDVSRPHSAYPSRMRFGDGEYLLTRESIETTATWYLNNTERPDNPDVSPLLAPDTGILPETIIVVPGYDPLLDEARLYAEALTTAGVPTRLECFETTIHAFLSLGVLDVAQQGRRFLAAEMKRCLFPES
jgi:acetyl esterase